MGALRVLCVMLAIVKDVTRRDVTLQTCLAQTQW
jgi:hypothetical protein